MSDDTEDRLPKHLLRPVSGFPELPPEQAIAQNRLLDTIRQCYEAAGYPPLVTSVMERPDVLFYKTEGEITAQTYGLRLLKPALDPKTNEPVDDDSKNLGLRYDHTVPLCRFVAANQVVFPFRRHAIGPSYRGERPKDGRYREFIQADIDVIGDGELNFLHDVEVIYVIADTIRALGIGEFTVKIGNRRILQGLIQACGITSEQAQLTAITTLDKLEKIGHERVLAELTTMGISPEDGENLLALVTEVLPNDTMLERLQGLEQNALLRQGIEELVTVVTGLRALGMSEAEFRVDPSISRGLAYYTSTVFETSLTKHPGVGSIASGGRFDDLAGKFAGRPMPGVGGSIGVSRLFFRALKAGIIKSDIGTVAPVLITTAAGLQYGHRYMQMANILRAAGIGVEVHLAERKLGKQLQFANRRGFTVAIIADEDHFEKQIVVVRNLANGEQVEVPADQMVEIVKKMLT